MTGPALVAVIGGGASGTLTALHLARTLAGAGRQVDIALIEPWDVGAGLAYSTPDPRHRLNVAAKGMSALPDDPEHFLRWLRRHVQVDFPAGGFAPRLYYAEYLVHSLELAVAQAPGVRLEHITARVTDIRRHGRRLRLTLDDRTSRPADAAVLAMGHGAPSTSWAPQSLARSARFVADPWRASSARAVRGGDAVLLVGAGLTMADMAQRWGRAGVALHVASRHGMLPLPHADAPEPPVVASGLPDGGSLAQARRFVFEHIRASGDWRRAIDGLRPFTAAMWTHLNEDERAVFLCTAARRWDRVRHRIDPALHAWLEQRRDDGSLTVHTAGVESAREDADGLHVQLTDGTVLTVAAVLNCTGTCTGLRSDPDPLVLNLLTSGTARPGPLDLGFAADDEGRILSSSGSQPAMWTVGPLRRGQLWESTAIPEIRVQAADVAREVVAALPSPRTADRRPCPGDPRRRAELVGAGGMLATTAADAGEPRGHRAQQGRTGIRRADAHVLRHRDPG